jgi:hypothetical protein
MLEKPAVTRGAAFLAVKSQESSQVSGKMSWLLVICYFTQPVKCAES